MEERKRRSVLKSARADGDGMRRPPGHFWGASEFDGKRGWRTICFGASDSITDPVGLGCAFYAAGVVAIGQAALTQAPSTHSASRSAFERGFSLQCIFITAENGGVAVVTLVSHSYPRWRGVTQEGVDPVVPFGSCP